MSGRVGVDAERLLGIVGAVVQQHQPVLTHGVRLTGSWRLIPRPVPQAQQSTVELRQHPRIGAVQDHLPKLREPSLRLHRTTSSTSASGPDPMPTFWRTSPTSWTLADTSQRGAETP